MTSNLSVFDITCNNLNVTDTLTVANTTYPSDIVYSINGESHFVYESFNSAVQSTIPVSVNLNNNSVSIQKLSNVYVLSIHSFYSNTASTPKNDYSQVLAKPAYYIQLFFSVPKNIFDKTLTTNTLLCSDMSLFIITRDTAGNKVSQLCNRKLMVSDASQPNYYILRIDYYFLSGGQNIDGWPNIESSTMTFTII